MELPAPWVAAAKLVEQQEGGLSANIACSRHLLLLEPFFTIQESPCGSGSKQCGISQTKKYGANALGLQIILGLGSYHPAWGWLHKFRRTMVRPGRDNLSGTVEIDETYIGGKSPGKRGRGADKKCLVAVAVEDKIPISPTGKGIGRIRLSIIQDASAISLNTFIQGHINEGSHIRSDGWSG
jgi:hypothetical protein